MHSQQIWTSLPPSLTEPFLISAALLVLSALPERLQGTHGPPRGPRRLSRQQLLGRHCFRDHFPGCQLRQLFEPANQGCEGVGSGFHQPHRGKPFEVAGEVAADRAREDLTSERCFCVSFASIANERVCLEFTIIPEDRFCLDFYYHTASRHDCLKGHLVLKLY